MESLHIDDLNASGNMSHSQKVSNQQRDNTKRLTSRNDNVDLKYFLQDNSRVIEENRVLRERIHLLKMNAALRAANIMGEVVSWIDSCCVNDKTKATDANRRRSPKDVQNAQLSSNGNKFPASPTTRNKVNQSPINQDSYRDQVASPVSRNSPAPTSSSKYKDKANTSDSAYNYSTMKTDPRASGNEYTTSLEFNYSSPSQYPNESALSDDQYQTLQSDNSVSRNETTSPAQSLFTKEITTGESRFKPLDPQPRSPSPMFGQPGSRPLTYSKANDTQSFLQPQGDSNISRPISPNRGVSPKLQQVSAENRKSPQYQRVSTENRNSPHRNSPIDNSSPVQFTDTHFGKRRGSIVYDTPTINVNYQPSGGFQSAAGELNDFNSALSDVNSISDGDMSSVFLKDDNERSHGHTWEKPKSKFMPKMMSTPRTDSVPAETARAANYDNSAASNFNEMDTLIKPEARRISKSPIQSNVPQYETAAPGYRDDIHGDNSNYISQQQNTSSPRPDFEKASSSRNYVKSRTSPTYFSPPSARRNTNDDSGMITPVSRQTRSPVVDYNSTSNPGAEKWSMPFAESQNSSTGKGSQAKKPRIKPTTRLIGEICFQLDRKMLNSVFRNKEHQRRRFYGYIIQNIMHKIDKECVVDDNTGMIDAQKKNILQFRYQHILDHLRHLGYDVRFHPDFCADMVNKYGLLPLPQDRNPTDGINADQKDVVYSALKRIAAKDELPHLKVILDCLAKLAQEDDSPMISF